MRAHRWISGAVATLVGLCVGGAASASAEPIAGRYIVVLKDSARDPVAVAAAHTRAYAVQESQLYRYALKGYAAAMSDTAAARLRSDPRVQFVARDRELHATELPTGVDRIDADASSTRSGDGSGTVDANVAVLDTGIGLDRTDLNVVGGKDCVQKGQLSYDDPNGHGTHAAGIVAASDDGPDIPGDPLEIVGVVPGARLWAVRVLAKNGNGSDAALLCGIDYVTSTRQDADPSNDIAVANLSLGGKGSDDRNCGLSDQDPIHRAICASTAAGVTYVAAAGNAGTDLATHVPAAYDEVLTVTAITDHDGQPGGIGFPQPPCSISWGDDTPALFSNFATLASDQAHTIAAPSACIWSTWIAPANAGIVSGTSQATPAVAGTAALCIARRSCRGTSAEIIQTLRIEAAAYNERNPGYGFLGDPLRPITGKYYGYLIHAGLY